MCRSHDDDGVQYIIPSSHKKKATEPALRVEQEIRRGFYQVHGVATRAPAKSSCPLSPFAFEDAKVVRAVNALPDDQRHWIKYAYCPEEVSGWEDESGAVVALWKEYEPQAGNVRSSTRKTLQGLAHLCIQDMKAQVNRGKGAHSPARIRELLGVPEANWRRDWSPRWRAMQEIVRRLDRDGLEQVATQLGPGEHVA
ncbi:bacteriophage antitermination protein Q [Marinobacterium jannaschii]|uniref:bacteriophage antitermination protein Q n=1 Tax=Marinobacterium jannaschii TaxID=64970 RepID=UPI001470DF2C|nr:bacteriophage antitermination protein Q [Marinobacterium jannaschii]